jgi:hypothetical protein
LHSEEFYNFPFVRNSIIRIKQENEMRWVRHVTLKGEKNRADLIETAEVKGTLSDF